MGDRFAVSATPMPNAVTRRDRPLSGDTPIPADLEIMNARVEELLKLPQDWNGYDAPPPNKTAARLADNALGIIARMGLPEPDILPSAEGGIVIGWYGPEKCGDTDFYNDGDAVASFWDRGDTVRVWEIEPVNDSEIEKSFRKIAEFLNLESHE